AVATIGTPDDLVQRIKSLLAASGGFGTVVGFVHDWANPENTMRSWDMVARYVVPEINGYLAGLRESREFVVHHREAFNHGREARALRVAARKESCRSRRNGGARAPALAPDHRRSARAERPGDPVRA